MHRLLQASVGDDQFPVVEDKMADQAIEKLCNFDAEGFRLMAELLHRLSQAVGALNITSSQRSHQFHVVIAGNAESLS